MAVQAQMLTDAFVPDLRSWDSTVGGCAPIDEQQLRMMSMFGSLTNLESQQQLLQKSHHQQHLPTSISGSRKRMRDQINDDQLSIPFGNDTCHPRQVVGGAANVVFNNDNISFEQQSTMTSTSGGGASSIYDSRDNLMSCLHNQNLEIDGIVRLQTERLRSVLEETTKRQCRALLSVVEKRVQKKLAEKDSEIEKANRRSLMLEEKLKQLIAENQIWFGVARNNEAVVTTLRTNLQQILLRQNNHNNQNPVAVVPAEDYAAGGGLVAAGNGDHGHHHDSFDAFSTGNLQLEDINFDDLFVGFDDGTGDILPDLELDPDELLGVFDRSFEDEMEMGSLGEMKNGDIEMEIGSGGEDGEKREGDSFKTSDGGDQTVPETTEEDVKVSESVVAVDERNGKDRKSTAGGLQKKRKVKVDWTPELHRRFVEAVDQLGVEKAVPSRILEIMGIDCLTRHNIASHLQKYRSHRKHVLAREAEAANWTQRRKIYSPTTSTVGHVVPVLKRETIAPWMGAPATMGFPTPPLPAQPAPPPAAAAPPSPSVQSFRPLHVWGHPTVEHHMIHMWPKHVVPSHPPHPPHHHWVAPPPHDPSAFWLPPHYQPRTPHYPHHPPLTPQRFQSPSPIATGIPPLPPTPPPPPAKHHHQFHPTKEIIDKVIGDVLTKPWLPLALGLKPPSVDSVLVALQKEGITKIPSHPSSSKSSLCS